MSPEDRLSEIFDRGLKDGVERLSTDERELYLIWKFILEWEQNGLSGYFYNRLPDVSQMQTTIDAMHRHRLLMLADLLSSALDLFREYADPNPPTTWDAVLRQYDPSGLLKTIDDQIGALKGYGLDESTIV